MNFEYCPRCGEHVDRGLSDEPGVALCENCETGVEPISDSEDSAMPHKAKHPIRCIDCGKTVELVGLHMGEFTDGVIVACECSSLGAIPSELGEPELPRWWEIDHTTSLDEDHDPNCDCEQCARFEGEARPGRDERNQKLTEE